MCLGWCKCVCSRERFEEDERDVHVIDPAGGSLRWNGRSISVRDGGARGASETISAALFLIYNDGSL